MSFFSGLARLFRAATPEAPAAPAAYTPRFATTLSAPTVRDILARCVDVWTTPRAAGSL